MNRVVDVSRRIVGDFSRKTRRQFAFDLLHFHAHTFDHVNRVGVRQHVNAHEHGLLSGEPHFGVIVFGAKNDVRDIPQPDESSLVLADDEFFEIIRRVQISVGSEVYLKQ